MRHKMKFFFVLTFLICSILCDLNKDRTYINIQNPIPCIRRFNATHQIGCGKLDYSSYEGIVYAVRNFDEFTRLKNISQNDIPKLVVVTFPTYFSQVVDLYLENKAKTPINGILLVTSQKNISNYTSSDSNFDSYSDDQTSPNNKFSLYSTNKTYGPEDWNPNGKGYMFENFEIPFYIVYEINETLNILEECYDKFNKEIFETSGTQDFNIKSSQSLCGMQLGIQMSGSVSSKVCARRSNIMHTLESTSYCDPLGGSNYFTFLSQKPSNTLPIVIFSARLDAFTMYEYYTPGANEPISSLIGFFGIIELLAKYKDDLDKNNLLLVLFDNEAFDYAGSARFSSDLFNDEFPSVTVNYGTDDDSFVLKKDNITTMIEISQLGSLGLDNSTKIYIHKDPISYGKDKNVASIINDLTEKLKKYSNGDISKIENINSQLPPSSIHSFLRHGLSIGGVSLADFEKKFETNFYHSVFDTPENLNITFPDNLTDEESVNYSTKFAQTLQKLSTSIAQTLYSLSSSKQTDLSDQVDLATLNKLVYCFYKNSTCKFFRSIMTDSHWKTYLALLDANLPKGVLSFYTGVSDNPISGKWLSTMLLRYFTRNLKLQSLNQTECSKDSSLVKQFQKENGISLKNFYFVNNSTCVASSIYPVSSVSPAFKDFDDGRLIDTDKYSAWTESSWNGVTVQMKLFMYTKSNVAGLTLSLGIVIAILAAVLTVFTDKFSNKIFSIKNMEQGEIFD